MAVLDVAGGVQYRELSIRLQSPTRGIGAEQRVNGKENMIDAFQELDPKLQSALISAGTAVGVLLLGWLWRLFYDRYSLKQKLKLEYTFEQQKSIKEEISKTKTPLLQAAENLNFRMWNLLLHKEENWLSRTPDEWTRDEHHYIRSFVYKWICLIHWILKAEKSVGRYDATLSPKEDMLYLKHIKAIKFCLCDRLLIEGLGYVSTETDNHFYIDDLARFADYIEGNDGIIEFHAFEEKVKDDIEPVTKVFLFFSKTKHEPANKSMNMLRTLHLLVLKFLNEFGHEYQQTEQTKISNLLAGEYSDIAIVSEMKAFFKRHKIDKSMMIITKHMVEQVAPANADKPRC